MCHPERRRNAPKSKDPDPYMRGGGGLDVLFDQAPTDRLNHSHASMAAIFALFSCPPGSHSVALHPLS